MILAMEKQFINEQDLLEDSFRLAIEIYNSGFRPDVIVGLWRGGSTVGIYVQECLQYLGVKTRHIAVRTSYEGAASYRKMRKERHAIAVHGMQYLYETLEHSDNLLIVDDVYSSGSNIEAVLGKLSAKIKRNMPEDTRVAALWQRVGKNRTTREPDYCLHQTENWLVLPYELTGLSSADIHSGKAYLESIIEDVRNNLPTKFADPNV